MKRFKKMFLVALSLLLTEIPSHASYLRRSDPLVQVAILLDTSNSMDGLIEQAKSQLWRIANDLAYASRYGERPVLQVALYEYGNNTIAPGENYVRQVLPFTQDLDLVSQKLFSLRTNGGQEYCGAVIRDAVHALNWSNRSDVYKVIFIAGNEPFTQGPVFFRDAIHAAVRKGISVNPIFCGLHQEGVLSAWLDGAMAGRGSYMTIDPNQRIVVDPTPYDAEIGTLGMRLNETYLAYGEEGRSAATNRGIADQLAMTQGAAAAPVERSLFKGSRSYASAAPDIVSEVASGKMSADKLERKDLPERLQSKSSVELERYLKEQQINRETIQSRLRELKKSREEFLAKRQSTQTGAAMSLDQAILKAVREQAGRLEFKFPQ